MLAFAAAITACQTKPEIAPPPLPTQHLEWPTELKPCEFNFEFIGEGDKAYVKIPYQDWIAKSKCEEQTLNYILNLTALTCSYRVALNEYRCEMFNKEEK